MEFEPFGREKSEGGGGRHGFGYGDMESVLFFVIEEGETVEIYHAIGDTSCREIAGDCFG